MNLISEFKNHSLLKPNCTPEILIEHKMNGIISNIGIHKHFFMGRTCLVHVLSIACIERLTYGQNQSRNVAYYIRTDTFTLHEQTTLYP